MTVPEARDLSASNEIDDVVRRVRRGSGPDIGGQRGGVSGAEGHLLPGIHQPIVVTVHPGEDIAGGGILQGQSLARLPDGVQILQRPPARGAGRGVGFAIPIGVVVPIHHHLAGARVIPRDDNLIVLIDLLAVSVRVLPEVAERIHEQALEVAGPLDRPRHVQGGGVEIRLVRRAFAGGGGGEHRRGGAGAALLENALNDGQQPFLEILHVGGLEVVVRNPVRPVLSRGVIQIVPLGRLVRDVVPVLIIEPAHHGRMHEEFPAGDVPERKEGVQRDVLEASQVMPRHIDHRDRGLTQVGGVRPVGDIVQVVGAVRGVIRLVLAQQRRSGRQGVRVTGAVGCMDGGVGAGAMQPMVAVGIVLHGRRNRPVLGRLAVRHDDDEGLAARRHGGRAGPGGRVVAREEVGVTPAGIGDISGRTGFSSGQPADLDPTPAQGAYAA